MRSRHGEEEKEKTFEASRAQSGLEQPGAKVAGVARLRCRAPDPNARSPTCPGRSSWSPSTRRYAASRSSGRDCSWPRSWCPSLASGPKPPVEGGTSCVALPPGNERDASTEPYHPSGSYVHVTSATVTSSASPPHRLLPTKPSPSSTPPVTFLPS
ncbi:hypothetical protein MTO96_008124 [Rhipicephalus appendiculatus]